MGLGKGRRAVGQTLGGGRSRPAWPTPSPGLCLTFLLPVPPRPVRVVMAAWGDVCSGAAVGISPNRYARPSDPLGK